MSDLASVLRRDSMTDVDDVSGLRQLSSSTRAAVMLARDVDVATDRGEDVVIRGHGRLDGPQESSDVGRPVRMDVLRVQAKNIDAHYFVPSSPAPDTRGSGRCLLRMPRARRAYGSRVSALLCRSPVC